MAVTPRRLYGRVTQGPWGEPPGEARSRQDADRRRREVCLMGQSVDILLPVFGIVALGFAAARLGWFDDAAREGLSHFVFTFAIPVLLFRTLAGTQLPHTLPW